MDEVLLGLCNDVKLVSRKRRCGGGVGLAGGRRPCSSCGFVVDRCGFLGPKVVITYKYGVNETVKGLECGAKGEHDATGDATKAV